MSDTPSRRNHLYWRVYLGLLGVIVACVVAFGAVAALHVDDDAWPPPELAGGLSVVGELLPDEMGGRRQHILHRFADRLDADLTLRSEDGRLIANAGPPVPHGPDGFDRADGRGVLRVTLDDGRKFAAAGRHGRPRRGPPFLFSIALVGLVVAAGAWPIARGVTRRLESVRTGVAAWGDGDLGARVPVEGADEVAEVARAFNQAADRVEGLVVAQRRVLASASHELRSPLARVRLALELLADGTGDAEALLADATRDVEELDRTVGDLLKVGRMQAVGVSDPVDVDVAALLAEEGAHVGAAVRGEGLTVRGDADLLRRLLRNLLENAVAHGGGTVEAWTAGREVVVADRGPGWPADAERLFEPFHRGAGHDEGRDGGVGLGLWLVREIAAAHGAEVVLRAREGGGAEAVVRFA